MSCSTKPVCKDHCDRLLHVLRWQLLALQGINTAGLNFRLVDAKEQVVGRLASQLSRILQVCVLHMHGSGLTLMAPRFPD